MNHSVPKHQNVKSSALLVSDRGFTMLEILVSLVLLTVGILGILSSVSSVMHYQRHSRDMTLATMHATNKLEEIKRVGTNEPTGGAFGFSHLVDSTAGGYVNGYTAPDDWTRSSSDTVDGMTRTWTLNIYPFQDANQDFTVPNLIRMVEAVVTVQWTDERGNQKNVELATVLHRRQFIQ